MSKNVAGLISGAGIGFLSAEMGYDVSTWQFWALMFMNVISLSSSNK